MKEFLIKNVRTIIFWAVFLTIVLYLVPTQHDYYLDKDIIDFKRNYLNAILLWTGILTSIAIFIGLLIKAKPFRQSVTALLSAGITIAFFLFIFQEVFLGVSLFINRLVKRDALQKVYVV
jgi:uncharacterized membrane protein YdfJ with MMPL/SSD domain